MYDSPYYYKPKEHILSSADQGSGNCPRPGLNDKGLADSGHRERLPGLSYSPSVSKKELTVLAGAITEIHDWEWTDIECGGIDQTSRAITTLGEALARTP